MVQASIIVMIITMVIILTSVLFLVLNAGKDADGNDLVDAFMMKGLLTCDGCTWTREDGTSEEISVELSVNTVGGEVEIELHASYAMHHWFLVDKTWYSIVDPGTVTRDGTPFLATGESFLFGTGLENEGVTMFADSDPVQYQCNKEAWDTAQMNSEFQWTNVGDVVSVTTPFGPMEITFANGLPSYVTAQYVPYDTPVGATAGQAFPVKLDLYENDGFVLGAGSVNTKFTFDSDSCTSIVRPQDNTVRDRRRALELESTLSSEEMDQYRAQMTKQIAEKDAIEHDYLASFGADDEGRGLAIQMDRNLRELTSEEELTQVAMGVYETEGIPLIGIPAGRCFVQGGIGSLLAASKPNGYEMVARGGYNIFPSGWTKNEDDVYNPMHAIICKKGNKCVFSWRGSTNLKNWINNINVSIMDIDGSTSGSKRRVHSGFQAEMLNGVNAKNSFDGPLKGQTLGTIWENMESTNGCTERYYTGHSLGGAAAALGHYHYEKSFTNKKFSSGTGIAVTFAAPQPWVTNIGNGISEEPLCDNKRFFVQTSLGDDPVPGILRTLFDPISKVIDNHKGFDHGDSAYSIDHDWSTCSWSPLRCSWRGTAPLRYKWCNDFWGCGSKTEIKAKGCDKEDGGFSLAVWHHFQFFYVDFMDRANSS